MAGRLFHPNPNVIPAVLRDLHERLRRQSTRRRFVYLLISSFRARRAWRVTRVRPALLQASGVSSPQRPSPPVSAMRPTSLWEELTRMRLAGRTSIVLRIRSLSTSSELPPAYPVKCLVAARVLTSVVLSPAARPAQSRKSSSCSSARARPHHRRRRGARRRLRREG